jgi:cupin 2 domain-containing protein
MCSNRDHPPASGNLQADTACSQPPPVPEAIDALLALPSLRIERILSFGHASPPGFWYDQAQAEWVTVLSGAALLQIEGETAPRHLQAGDWINLPAHCRHRLEWTDPARPTVWLAVHYPEPD